MTAVDRGDCVDLGGDKASAGEPWSVVGGVGRATGSCCSCCLCVCLCLSDPRWWFKEQAQKSGVSLTLLISATVL